MREIKFNFIYGIDGETETYIKKTFTFGEIESGYHMDWISDSPLLQKYSILAKRQYTGLKDKNGVEIYEGDIVESKTVFMSDFKQGPRLFVIDFEDGTFCFRNTEQWDDGSHDWTSIENVEMFETEVIGNIHENPEQLGS